MLQSPRATRVSPSTHAPASLMAMAIRWRIIALQVVAVLVLIFGSFGALYAHNFVTDQIHQQLAPQQIVFPANAAAGLPGDLSTYAGQQVLTGDQAHAYADKFIAVHLREIGQGHPYSYWSGLAQTATDPALKAKEQAVADTLFKGETLRSILNQVWTFSVIARLALYAAIGLLLAALVVMAALAFEVIEAFQSNTRERNGAQVPLAAPILHSAAGHSEPALHH